MLSGLHSKPQQHCDLCYLLRQLPIRHGNSNSRASLRESRYLGQLHSSICMHFAFMAGVNRQMKQCYEAYCNIVKDPPIVNNYCIRYTCKERVATKRDTFNSTAFNNVACAEFWHNQATKANGYPHNPSLPRLETYKF
jgi:hypothetical protein